MLFTCERETLLEAVLTAGRAAAARSPITAIEGLLIETLEEGLRITGYDLKKGIFMRAAADVTEPGAIILNARLFTEIVRNMPDGIVKVACDESSMCTISSGMAEFNIIGIPAESFPEMPEVDHQQRISLRQDIIRKMIGETVFSVGDDESRPIYTGALFEMSDTRFTIVALDGFRLALRREDIETAEIPDCSFIVPGYALNELERMCSDSEETVKITLGSKHISFTIGEKVLVSRRLEGEFLDYRKSVPEEYSVSVTAGREDLLRVVDRVSLIIDDRTKNPLRCVFGEDKIDFTCITPLGKAEDVCRVDGDGKGIEIGFNNKYLRDAVKAAPADELMISLSSGVTPCVIRPVEGDSFLYMILPVRLKAE